MIVLISYRITSCILGLIIAWILLLLIRGDHLHIKYSLLWFSLAIMSAFLGIFPGIIDYFGKLFGVHYPPMLLVIIGIGLIMIKILLMDINRSEHERQIRILTTRLALLENEKETSVRKKNYVQNDNRVTE